MFDSHTCFNESFYFQIHWSKHISWKNSLISFNIHRKKMRKIKHENRLVLCEGTPFQRISPFSCSISLIFVSWILKLIWDYSRSMLFNRNIWRGHVKHVLQKMGFSNPKTWPNLFSFILDRNETTFYCVACMGEATWIPPPSPEN